MNVRKIHCLIMLFCGAFLNLSLHANQQWAEEYKAFNLTSPSVLQAALQVLLPKIPADASILIVGDPAMCKTLSADVRYELEKPRVRDSKFVSTVECVETRSNGLTLTSQPKLKQYEAVIFAVPFTALLDSRYFVKTLEKYTTLLVPGGYFLFTQTASERAFFTKGKRIGWFCWGIKRYMSIVMKNALLVKGWENNFTKHQAYKHHGINGKLVGMIYLYQK